MKSGIRVWLFLRSRPTEFIMYITRDQLISLPSVEFNELLCRVDEDTEDLLHLLLHGLLFEESVEIPDDLVPFSLRV